MSDKDVVEDLERRARRIHRYVKEVEAGQTQARLSISSVELGYCGALLSWTTELESCLERLFFGYLTSRYSWRGRAVSLVAVRSPAVARRIVHDGNTYVDWLPYWKTEKRANSYFSQGKPFAALDEDARRALDQLQVVRNVIAHDSKHARGQFRSRYLDGLALRPQEKRVGGYLRSAVSLNETRLESIISRTLFGVRSLIL